VLTLIYVNSSKVEFLTIGSPWSIIGPYLKKVAELTPGMAQFIFGDFNYNHPNTETAWKSELRDGLLDLKKRQINNISNAADNQNDQVWVDGIPEEVILNYEVWRLPRLSKMVDLTESILMIVDASDICSTMQDKDGPAEYIHFQHLIEAKYDVFKVTTKNLDFGALLMAVPNSYHGFFVHSSACYFVEANVVNETLKSSVSLLSVRVGRGAVLTLIYVNSSKVEFLTIGSPWSIIGPYLKKVAELTPGMAQFIFGDFNYNYPNTEAAWQSELRDGLLDLKKTQINNISNAADNQNDQVWVDGIPEEVILNYEVA
jgi:hypothetical protein